MQTNKERILFKLYDHLLAFVDKHEEELHRVIEETNTALEHKIAIKEAMQERQAVKYVH